MAISHRLSPIKALLPWAWVLFVGAATAQVPAGAKAPEPSLPTKLQYSSAIDAYQAYTDQPVQSWREANDRVGRIGGWRVYAREIKTGVPASFQGAAGANGAHTGQHGGAKP